MMMRAKPLVFHSTNSAIVGLAQVVVVSQPMDGPPRYFRKALTTPKSLSKIRMNAWAMAASGVTNGRMTTVRSVFLNLRRDRVSAVAIAIAPIVWIGTISSHMIAELPSDAQKSWLVNR